MAPKPRRSVAPPLPALALLVVCALFAVACSSSLSVAEAERAVPPTAGADAADDADTADVEPEDDAEVPTPEPAADNDADEQPAEDQADDPAPAVPTVPPEPTATTAPEPTPQPEGPCGVGPLALPNPDRPVYRAELIIDPESRSVQGSVIVDFTPDLPIDELVLRLWPNGPRPAAGGVTMTLSSIVLGEPGQGAVVDSIQDDPTLVRVPLPAPVAAGETVSFEAAFELVIPSELRSRISATADYMRLGTVLPILPWEPGRGWATEPATGLFAEAVSSPVADYEVTVFVPDGYEVLASGEVDVFGTWRVQAARDFALSVGRFSTVSGVANAPNPVQITVGVHESLGDDENAYLAKVIDSLEQFSGRWGEYPWPSLTFALTPNLGGGIEFPTHIMQGPDTIGRTTSHEVGHMYFYSLVGNNQGSEPWLDEGITSYAEFTYEGLAAGAYSIPEAGIGRATEPMTFWEGKSDIYYRSVYGQTGFALLELGSQEAVDCALARYVADNAHQIATAADFVAAFEPTFPDVVERLAELGVSIDQ